MPQLSRADSHHTFCSYCGFPPPARWRRRAHFVCASCEHGYMVQTTPGAVPRYDEPFVIVDSRLRVQAVSLQAEDVLMVPGSESFGAQLARYLISDDPRDPTGAQLTLRITLAVEGRTAPGTLRVRTASAPEIRFKARLSSCRPPAAALLVLTPVPGRRQHFDEREREREREHTTGRRRGAPNLSVLTTHHARRRGAG